MRMTKQQKTEARAKHLDLLRKALAIIKTGKCPQCGTKLYRNLALAGWYQCGHFGADGFQKEPGPQCDFQIFYDPSQQDRELLIAEEYGRRA